MKLAFRMYLGPFILLTSFLLSIILLPVSGSIQQNEGPHVTISDLISGGKGVVITSDTDDEWLGAVSAYTRVSDINNDSIDDLFIGGHKLHIFFGRSEPEWTNYSVTEADASVLPEPPREFINMLVGVRDVNNDGFNDVLGASIGWGSSGDGDSIPKAYLFFGGNPTDWEVNTSATNADVVFAAEAMGDFFGHGMDGVGDVDADGYDDFVITSENNDKVDNNAGKAYLVLGKSTNDWNKTSDIDQAASASFLGTEAGGHLGVNAAGVGDVNNDGFDDFLLSAYKIFIVPVGYGFQEIMRRAVYLVFGRPTQQWQMEEQITDVANITILVKTEDSMGWAQGKHISGAGDVNSDGIDDFIVGAYLDDEGGVDSGQSFLFLGRSNDLWPSSPSTVNASDYASASFIGEAYLDRSGYSVSGMGDFNNDGYDDLLVGASNAFDLVSRIEGKAYVIFGRPTDQWKMDQSLSGANLTITGGFYAGINARFATDVSGIGDINNDGFADFLIGVPWVNTRGGMICVIFGSDEWGQVSPTSTTSILTQNTSSLIPTSSSTTTSTTAETSPSFVQISAVFSLIAIILIRKRKANC